MKKEARHLHFHGDDVAPSSPEDALFHVIPVPLEQSVSYGTGTANGPSAILEASCQLETLALGVDPSIHGIHTAAPIDCQGPVSAVLERIEDEVSLARSIPVVLGGEHTVTLGAVNALRKRHPQFGVVQFDAHADLRNIYEENPLSHACVMRRVHELGIPLVQVGTRSYCLEEQEYRQQHAIPFFDSEEIHRHLPKNPLPDDFPEQIYITFDIDGLDPSLVPATGTPVPGGLGWFQAMDLIKPITKNRTCIGFDVVELAPIPYLHSCSFTAAQLVYNIMACVVLNQ